MNARSIIDNVDWELDIEARARELFRHFSRDLNFHDYNAFREMLRHYLTPEFQIRFRVRLLNGAMLGWAKALPNPSLDRTFWIWMAKMLQAGHWCTGFEVTNGQVDHPNTQPNYPVYRYVGDATHWDFWVVTPIPLQLFGPYERFADNPIEAYQKFQGMEGI